MATKHIYIHFPYCLYKCHYCDFNSYAYEKKDIPQTNYLQALLTEIRLRRQIFAATGISFFADGDAIETVFFGGGTPSLMNPKDVELILAELRKSFVFAPDIEITLESNPGTVTKQALADFKAAGINRVSIGLQSFHDEDLKRFGRIHTGMEGKRAIEAALESGITRVSGDLIFGFPDQTLRQWENNLDTILSFGLKHVSAYALTAEEGTQFTSEIRRGLLKETDAELFAAMQEATYDRFEAAELSAYEISNFAVPGEESRHNLGYWRYQAYVGLGAGAFSTYFYADEKGEKQFAARESNHKVPEHYMRKVAEGADFFTTESLDKTTTIKEALMMGLRLSEGLDVTAFGNRFECSLEELIPQSLKRHLELGVLHQKEKRLFVTRKGFLLNNQLLADLFYEMDASNLRCLPSAAQGL